MISLSDPHLRGRRLAATTILAMVLPFSSAAIADVPRPAAEARPALKENVLDSPAIREVLAMVAAGIADRVIIERIERMGSVPLLTGDQLAELKTRGVSDDILLVLIRLGGRSAPPAPPHPPGALAPGRDALLPPPGTVERADSAVTPRGQGRLRVVVRAGFPVTAWTIAVDGRPVRSEGSVLRDAGGAGEIITRPRRVRLGNDAVWEGNVPAGPHRVEVGFAVTEVVSDPNDEWSEYSREHYASAGVSAPGPLAALPDLAPGRAVRCEVPAGGTCTVTATLEKHRRSRFVGRSTYSVTYRTASAP